MKSRCRVLLAGSVLLSSTLLLTACEGIGRGMAESDMRAHNARYAAQGNPQFSDPQLRAVVQRFEADFAAIGFDTGKLGLDQGTPCPATQEAAFRTVFGMTPQAHAAMEAEVAQKVPGYTGIADPDAVRLVTLQGVCGANGPEGPAVVVGTQRTITRYRGEGYSNVTVTDAVMRIDATWIDGERREPRSLVMISQSAPFKETAEGQLAEDINDWAYINEMREAPAATYIYFVTNPDGSMKYQVTFSRNDGAGVYGTAVREFRDAQHSYARNWQGTELISEASYKNGELHGWHVVHPTSYNGTPIPGRRDCYQNGELVKALECPAG
ncbi:MAG: hypothetical protein Kow00114_17130 [Kiloniellaceae bacterium]